MSRRTLVALGLLLALVLAGGVSYYASSQPDGLDKAARDTGIATAKKDSAAADSPLAGYEADGVENSRLSGGLAGVVGVGVTFLLVGGVVLAVRRGQDRTRDTDPADR